MTSASATSRPSRLSRLLLLLVLVVTALVANWFTPARSMAATPAGTCPTGSAFDGWTYSGVSTMTASEASAFPTYPETPPTGYALYMTFPAGTTAAQACTDTPTHYGYTQTNAAGAYYYASGGYQPIAGSVIFSVATGAGAWAPARFPGSVAPPTPTPSPTASPTPAPVASSPAPAPVSSSSPAWPSCPTVSATASSAPSSPTSPSPSPSSVTRLGVDCPLLVEASSGQALGLWLFLGSLLLLGVCGFAVQHGRRFRD